MIIARHVVNNYNFYIDSGGTIFFSYSRNSLLDSCINYSLLVRNGRVRHGHELQASHAVGTSEGPPLVPQVRLGPALLYLGKSLLVSKQ